MMASKFNSYFLFIIVILMIEKLLIRRKINIFFDR